MAGLTNSVNANSITPLLPIQGGTGVSSPTAHGVLISEGTGAFTPIVLTAGEVLIGTTSSDPTGATLTAGTNISITSASGSITIAGTSSTWITETSGPVTMAVNSKYFAASATQISFVLPAVAAVGSSFEICATAAGTGGWIINEGTGQSIIIGNETTTTTSGSITSNSTQGDWIMLVCSIANTGFVASMRQGQATVA